MGRSDSAQINSQQSSLLLTATSTPRLEERTDLARLLGAPGFTRGRRQKDEPSRKTPRSVAGPRQVDEQRAARRRRRRGIVFPLKLERVYRGSASSLLTKGHRRYVNSPAPPI